MSESVIEITDESFQDEVIEEGGVVVVDYYATWCGPCKAIGFAMEQLSKEYPDTLKVVKGNIEENSDSVSKFGINGVPAILMFKDGELISQHVGLRTLKDIKKDVEEVRNA
jgi:thioredoxin 1